MRVFDEIFVDKTKYGTKIKTDDYQEYGLYPIIDQGQKQIAGYTDLSEGVFTDVPAIIFGDHTRIIKYVDKPFFIGADGVKILKSNLENANYKYLYYALLNAKIPNTGYNRHFKWLKQLKFSCPDLDRQKSIVNILDNIKIVIDFRTKQLEKYDELIKARFVEMFGDPNCNKNNLVKISDIGLLMSGGTPPRKEVNYFNGEIRWYSAGELNSLYLGDSIEHISSKAIEESSAKLFKKSTLMIGMYDTAAFKMGILTEESSSNQACANLQPSDRYNVIWLYYLFDIMKPKFLNERQGVRQKNLSLSKIKGFMVPYSETELQNQFADFVKQIDKSKFVVQKSLDKAQLLFDSLMQEYFG